MNYLMLFLFMCFAHIIDDYFLQGCLANLKQKGWWEKNYPDKKYNKDYIAGLVCHSFSWSFMIMLPLAINSGFDLGWLFIAYPVNMIIHAVIDDLKANKFKINLIQDQLFHFIQIGLTFGTYCLVMR